MPPSRPIFEWPWAARQVARRRALEDKGLGDTVARTLPAKAFNWFYRRLTGHDCPTCGNRQAWLNALFPYVPEEPD